MILKDPKGGGISRCMHTVMYLVNSALPCRSVSKVEKNIYLQWLGTKGSIHIVCNLKINQITKIESQPQRHLQ